MEALTQDEEKRLARLQKYSEQVSSAYERMVKSINSGESDSFSEDEVKFYLSNTPTVIAESGLFLAKLQRAWRYSQIDVKVVSAEVWKKCNRLKEELGLSSAKDREAFVQTQPELIKAQRIEVEFRFRVDQMQVIYERYCNLYLSARKLASLIPTYNKAQDDYIKYNKEYGVEDE